MPIIVTATIFMSLHAFIKSQTDSTFVEKFPFLCSYMNNDINLSEEERGCKTSSAITSEYDTKTTVLEKEIVNKLAVYVPIKISSKDIGSNEKKFIKETFEAKIPIKNIMDDFNKVLSQAQTR